MDPEFRTDVELTPPEWLRHRTCGCSTPGRPITATFACAQHGRRLFTALGAAVVVAPGAVWAQQDGVAGDEGLRKDVGKNSKWTKLVSAESVEESAALQFQQMSRQAQQKKALAPDNHPQLIRLRAIADRIIPFAPPWNPRASQWKWEVQLFGDPTVNAFCMPGGKIAFYFGILDKLQLSDDEVAMIMGHEVAHALREHARERMGKTAATRVGANLISSFFGLGGLGDAALGAGAQLLTLKFGRDDETEADLVGLDLAARAGYNPEAGITLWRKMLEANKNAPPQFLSTHPAGDTRIQDIQKVLPKVQPLYARAPKPDRVFGPPTAKRG